MGVIMIVEKHEQMENGQWRRARKTHPCDIVSYFGVKPHEKCTGTAEKSDYYFDTNQLDGSGPFKTHKLCRWCAQMELDTAVKMTPEERKNYRENRK